MTTVALSPELCVYVDVPICAFRPYESREYQDTDPVPPPSAVYGMLLSLCGVQRDDKLRHAGVSLALAIEGNPERARVFRKLRRGKELEDVRPDYQDLLIGIRLWVWISSDEDRAATSLTTLISEALTQPKLITRNGGLSLGESSYLVDSISIRSPVPEKVLQFLIPEQSGFFSLSVWVDHEHNRRRRDRFAIKPVSVEQGLNQAWIRIKP